MLSTRRRRPRLAPLLLLALATPPPLGAQDSRDFAIVDACVFDGERVLPRATVVVRDGRIASVSARRPARLPPDVVDGRGRTLLPGLIDAHFHSNGRERILASALRAGETTVLDMYGRPELPAQLRTLRDRPDLADTRAAGAGATAPGGHGTQYGYPAPTLSTSDSAEAFVAARVAEGSDYLKVIVDHGLVQPRPTLDSATVAAVVAAAHRRGRLAVAHSMRARDAEMALRTGADGLVHLWTDTGAAPAVAALAAARKAFVTPTLAVLLEGGTAGDESRALAADPRLAALLPDSVLRAMRDPAWVRTRGDTVARAFRAGADTAAYRRRLYDAVVSLQRAGVRILAGSDAPNFGMGPVFLHRELELLVAAGLTPVDALAAATSGPADAFRLTDRGRIGPGLRADLLLVEGDPTTDVTATRAIVEVWKQGKRLARERPSPPVLEADTDSPDRLLRAFYESSSAGDWALLCALRDRAGGEGRAAAPLALSGAVRPSTQGPFRRKEMPCAPAITR